MDLEDHEDEKFLGLSRRILLAAVFSLLFVVIMVILLHFYTRYLASRQERRRRAFLNSLTGQVAPLDHLTTISVYREPPLQATSGLGFSAIDSLPTFEYDPAKEVDGGGGEPRECSVCLSFVVGGARVRMLPNCKHLFHVDCIDKWLGSHTTCPICRTGVKPEMARQEEKVVEARIQPSAPPVEGDAQDLERQ